MPHFLSKIYNDYVRLRKFDLAPARKMHAISEKLYDSFKFDELSLMADTRSAAFVAAALHQMKPQHDDKNWKLQDWLTRFDKSMADVRGKLIQQGLVLGPQIIMLQAPRTMGTTKIDSGFDLKNIQKDKLFNVADGVWKQMLTMAGEDETMQKKISDPTFLPRCADNIETYSYFYLLRVMEAMREQVQSHHLLSTRRKDIGTALDDAIKSLKAEAEKRFAHISDEPLKGPHFEELVHAPNN
jgi:hypothetical protein